MPLIWYTHRPVIQQTSVIQSKEEAPLVLGCFLASELIPSALHCSCTGKSQVELLPSARVEYEYIIRDSFNKTRIILKFSKLEDIILIHLTSCYYYHFPYFTYVRGQRTENICWLLSTLGILTWKLLFILLCTYYHSIREIYFTALITFPIL